MISLVTPPWVSNQRLQRTKHANWLQHNTKDSGSLDSQSRCVSLWEAHTCSTCISHPTNTTFPSQVGPHTCASAVSGVLHGSVLPHVEHTLGTPPMSWIKVFFHLSGTGWPRSLSPQQRSPVPPGGTPRFSQANGTTVSSLRMSELLALSPKAEPSHPAEGSSFGRLYL